MCWLIRSSLLGPEGYEEKTTKGERGRRGGSICTMRKCECEWLPPYGGTSGRAAVVPALSSIVGCVGCLGGEESGVSATEMTGSDAGWW